MKLNLLPLLSSTILAAMLVGCGGGVLDWRNADVSKGVIYQHRANTPFDGEVTNIPFGLVFGQQPGYQQLMGQAGSIITVLFGGALLCDAEVSEGMFDGDISCRPSQQKDALITASFKRGVLNGTFEMLDEKTHKATAEATFKDGKLNGRAKRYDPKTGRLVYEQEFEMGNANGKFQQWDSNGTPLLDAHISNGKFDGSYTSKDLVNHVEVEGRYDHGVFSGTKHNSYYVDATADPELFIYKITRKIERDQITNQAEVDAQSQALDQINSCRDSLRINRIGAGWNTDQNPNLTPVERSEIKKRQTIADLGECKKSPNAAKEMRGGQRSYISAEAQAPVSISSSGEYQKAYKCAKEALQANFGPTSFCVGNSRDPSSTEEQAYRDAERDFKVGK